MVPPRDHVDWPASPPPYEQVGAEVIAPEPPDSIALALNKKIRLGRIKFRTRLGWFVDYRKRLPEEVRIGGPLDSLVVFAAESVEHNAAARAGVSNSQIKVGFTSFAPSFDPPEDHPSGKVCSEYDAAVFDFRDVDDVMLGLASSHVRVTFENQPRLNHAKTAQIAWIRPDTWFRGESDIHSASTLSQAFFENGYDAILLSAPSEPGLRDVLLSFASALRRGSQFPLMLIVFKLGQVNRKRD